MSYLTGMFEADLFDEIRGMGDLPSDARPIAELETYRSRFPRLTALTALRSGGITHFTATPGTTGYTFWYYDATGTRKGNQALPIPESERPSGPIEPQKDTSYYPTLAPLPGDGLLPSETEVERQSAPSGAARWLPWALVGGAVVVGGGLVFMVARRPRSVAANRRRVRRRSSRRRR